MQLTRLLFYHKGKFHNKHERWIGRTVIVKDGKVEEAFRVLNRILGQEGIFDAYRRTRCYEKPYQVRNRINYTMTKAIYDEDMQRKIKFAMRVNRNDPWIGMVD